MEAKFRGPPSAVQSWCVLGLLLLGCGAGDLDPGDVTPAGAAEPTSAESEEVSSLFAGQAMVCSGQSYSAFCAVLEPGLYPFPADMGIPQNDTLSSFQVGHHTLVTFCKDAKWGGQCETYSGGTQGLSIPQISSPPDNSVSSMRVVLNDGAGKDCRTGDPPEGAAYLYREPNYQGDCVVKNTIAGPTAYPDITVIGLQDNSLSSLKVGPRHDAILWSDPNFKGQRVNYIHTFDPSVIRVPQVDRNDTMSSIQF